MKEEKEKEKVQKKIMEERVKLAEKVKKKAIAEAEKAKDEYLEMVGYKFPKEDRKNAEEKKEAKPKALA